MPRMIHLQKLTLLKETCVKFTNDVAFFKISNNQEGFFSSQNQSMFHSSARSFSRENCAITGKSLRRKYAMIVPILSTSGECFSRKHFDERSIVRAFSTSCRQLRDGAIVAAEKYIVHRENDVKRRKNVLTVVATILPTWRKSADVVVHGKLKSVNKAQCRGQSSNCKRRRSLDRQRASRRDDVKGEAREMAEDTRQTERRQCSLRQPETARTHRPRRRSIELPSSASSRLRPRSAFTAPHEVSRHRARSPPPPSPSPLSHARDHSSSD